MICILCMYILLISLSKICLGYPGCQRLFQRGQHQKFPLHARKTSGTQGKSRVISNEIQMSFTFIILEYFMSYIVDSQTRFLGRPLFRTFIVIRFVDDEMMMKFHPQQLSRFAGQNLSNFQLQFRYFKIRHVKDIKQILKIQRRQKNIIGQE